jgi:hypothetical protein
MSKFAYPEIWKKSFLLEIVTPSAEPSEIFTFSLPPENIEIVYPQRISETKTFGGLFVDDYGFDVAKIALSGNTGNSEVRRIYRGARGDLWLSGKDEIYYIRDHIIRYKENNPNYGDTKLYLYNLSTISEEELTNGNYSAATDSWEVILKDFRITQSKDRPFWYTYSIEFTGLRVLGREKESIAAREISPASENPIQLLDDADAAIAPLESPEELMMIQSGDVSAQELSDMHQMADEYLPSDYCVGQPVEERLKVALVDNKLSPRVLAKYERDHKGEKLKPSLDKVANSREKQMTVLQKANLWLENTYKWSAQIASPVRNVRKQISKLKSQVQTYKNLTSAIINNTLFSIPLQAIGLVKDVQDLGVGIITAPADIACSVMSEFKKVRKGVQSISHDIETGAVPEYVKNRYNNVVEQFKSEVEACTYKAENNIAAVAASSKNTQTSPDIYIVPSKDNTNIRVTLAYGYMYVASSGETSLDALAAKYLGDPDDAVFIALANGISEETEIEPGDILRIPLSTQNNIVYNNEVYSRTDNYGVDIALSESGKLIVDASGELSTVSGETNINQALQMRLAEAVGNRIRLTVYGIKANIGKPLSSASAYVATSIKDTVIHDPRVSRVENFVFRGVGDRIYVEFDYLLIDGQHGTYRGTA